MRAEDKGRIVSTVIDRVCQRHIQKAGEGGPLLERLINDTIYHEKNRLANEKNSREVRKAYKYWKNVHKRVMVADQQQQQQILREIVTLFANEIVGHFNDRVYQFATRVLPLGLSFLLKAISPTILWKNISHLSSLPDLEDRVLIQGEVEAIRALHEKGTVILVPTHSSNMDSIVIGWALYRIGLPPFTYGAGINLFTNWMLSYFMHNLGAYKVDRKKVASLYKETLKEYATVTLENNYNNLFFPGGGRTRSGGVEQKLKLGLMGTGVEAYINNLLHQKQNPNIYVVPCTLSYQLVLEAENISTEFLKQTGKSRFIIEDDEFSKLRRILNFMSSILRMNSRIYVTFCPPMDLFGNRVDNEGISYDKAGRPIDISRYVMDRGQYVHSEQRDQEYTRHLGRCVAKTYLKYNVLMSTNIVAFAVFKVMQQQNPEMDIYRLLRTRGKEESVAVSQVIEYLQTLVKKIHQLVAEKRVLLDERLKDADAEEMLERGLRHLRAYHLTPVVIRRGERIIPSNPPLLLYYHNRLMGYGLEDNEE